MLASNGSLPRLEPFNPDARAANDGCETPSVWQADVGGERCADARA